MPTYNVHIYREMRLYYPGVEADTPEHAAAFADDLSTDVAELCEDCDGRAFSALVDVAGDDEYIHSRMIDFQPNVEAILTGLETAISAMNATPSFNTGLTDPDNPKRTMSSYKLLPKLTAIVRAARGQI